MMKLIRASDQRMITGVCSFFGVQQASSTNACFRVFRRNLSWARLDEVLENEQKISYNPDWLTLEVDEDPTRNIWPNRKKKCSWEAECTGAVLRALDQLERKRGGVTTQASLLRAYGDRGQV